MIDAKGKISFLLGEYGYNWSKVTVFFCVWVLILRAAFGLSVDPAMITLITVLQGFKFGKTYVASKNGNGNGNGIINGNGVMNGLTNDNSK